MTAATLDSYNVHLAYNTEDDIDEDALHNLVDTLDDSPCIPIVAGGSRRYEVTLAIDIANLVGGYDPLAAAEAARDIVEAAAVKAGLPHGRLVRCDVTDEHEQDRLLNQPAMPQLAGVAEAAELLGVTRQRISTMAASHPTFPKPIMRLASGPVWTVDALRTFDEQWDRKPGRRAQVVDATAARQRLARAGRRS